MSTAAIIWLVLLIIFIVVEIATVGLASIWFAAGALVAMILELAGVGSVWQIILFFVVSIVMLVVTRPFASRYINAKHEKTNYEGLIGKVARVTEDVDNIAETGRAIINGQEWTARTENDSDELFVGDIAVIVDIQGVKLIIKKQSE